MNNSTNLIRLAIIFLVAVSLQILVFDNVDFIGLCNPFVYVVVLLSVPIGCPTWLLMLIGFFTGLAIDVPANTPGMHAAACVFVAYIRQFILSFLSFRSAYKDDDMPNLHVYGSLWYIKYATLIVVLHHIVLFFAEQFDSLFFWPTMLRIVLSIVATLLAIFLFQIASPRVVSASVN